MAEPQDMIFEVLKVIQREIAGLRTEVAGLRTEVAGLHARMDGYEARTELRFAVLEARMDRGFAEIAKEFDSMRLLMTRFIQTETAHEARIVRLERQMDGLSKQSEH